MVLTLEASPYGCCHSSFSNYLPGQLHLIKQSRGRTPGHSWLERTGGEKGQKAEGTHTAVTWCLDNYYLFADIQKDFIQSCWSGFHKWLLTSFVKSVLMFSSDFIFDIQNQKWKIKPVFRWNQLLIHLYFNFSFCILKQISNNE